MKNKRNSVKTTLSYNLGGITRIWLLDINKFLGYKFENDQLSDQCSVESIVASSEFIELEAISESNFTENLTDGLHKQKISTFIYPLSAENLANITVLSSKKYLVAFKTIQNNYFCFGSDGGAIVSFSQQTGKIGDMQRYSISIEKSSAHLLYQIKDIANIISQYKYVPIFEDGVFCQLKDGKQTGRQVATYLLKTSVDGEAVDVDGNQCSESGMPQAIRIMEGFRKPDGNYQIESTYPENETKVEGYFITKQNTTLCKTEDDGFINITPSQIIFDSEKEQETITVDSNRAWKLTPPKNEIAMCDRNEGGVGSFDIVVTKTEKEGIENFIFTTDKNKQATLNVINYTDKVVEWVLKPNDEGESVWNENGFWLDNEIWS